MAVYFADTWLFIAGLDRFDKHHLQASRLWSGTRNDLIVTHDGVFTELLALFVGGGAQARLKAVEAVRRSFLYYEVLAVDRTLFRRGLERYAARPDKEYSHVDCMSMIVMEDFGITHILTNDHHFEQAGFTLVNA